VSALPESDLPAPEWPPAAPSPRTQSNGASRWETPAVAALAVALVYVVLFWRLGVPTFWDPDEAHYAQTSREMIASGDYLAPYYNDEPFFDKPALFHMLQAAAMVLLGATELAARIVPAVAALGLIAATGWIGSAVASRSVGLVAGLMLAASPAVFALARYAILDTVFAAFLFGGASCVTVAALKDRPRLQWPGYVLVGLAILTKGPLALALCGLAFVTACAASSELRRRLWRLHWVAGLALAVAIAAPWFLYMDRRFGEAFINGYVLDENFRLYASSRFANQPRPWFYFQILATGLLPWTGVLVGRLIDDAVAVGTGQRVDAFEILLWSWVAVVVGFFTASSFKLDHYVFPAAPALCLLFARGWADLREAPQSTRHRATRVGARLVGPMLVAMGIGMGYFLIARLDLPASAIVVPMVITACGVAVTLIIHMRLRDGGKPPQVPWFGLAALLTAYIGILVFAVPALEARKVVPDVARVVQAKAGPEHRIGSYRLNRWNPVFRFYVDRHVVLLENPVEARAFFDGTPAFYCVMHRSAYDEFVAQGAALRIVYQRDGIYASSGRALWRRRLNPAQFVVVEPAR
jgi:4-amino-4-deoxy-L-arabinose transferase-like glycosyltransferase